MDRLSELGTARGFAEQRVARAEAELAEAKKDLGRCVGAYIDYVKLQPKCFECGEMFAAEDGDVGDTYAFCCDECRQRFMAGLGF